MKALTREVFLSLWKVHILNHAVLRCEVDAAGGLRAQRNYYLTPRGRVILRHIRDQIERLQGELSGKDREYVPWERKSQRGRRKPSRSGDRSARRER